MLKIKTANYGMAPFQALAIYQTGLSQWFEYPVIWEPPYPNSYSDMSIPGRDITQKENFLHTGHIPQVTSRGHCVAEI